MSLIELSDADVLTFAFAGCNAVEISAYSGTSEAVAQARLNRVLRDHGRGAASRETLHLQMTSRACPTCGATHSRSVAYCRNCHAGNMREWRKTHPLSDEQRQKSNCRSYTRELIKRGTLVRQACRDCGATDTEAHHPDYSKPRLVIWLCRPCHLSLHRAEQAA